ncbi:MAG: TIGR00266 family protein [Butyrivibrio sp.]|nr:TIGR00266 family protein [Butyrivibrio sp.]
MQYQIMHQPFTVVTLQMNQGDSIKCQSGAMAWVSRGIKMETKVGGIGGLFKKALVGESIALNHYTAQEPGELTLAKHSPGDIVAYDVSNCPIIAQKSSFLASSENVNIDIYLHHKVGAGLFGGEGFIMQRLSGSGHVFLEIDGAVQEKTLAAGESIVIDSGYVAAMEETCKMEIETVKGFTNVFLGGEGLFNTVVTGPGKVWLQTMPINALAMSLYAYMPHPSSNN